MKLRVLVPSLFIYAPLTCMEQPPQRNFFSHLPADVKEYLLPFVVSGTLKDMTRGLYNLAALDKKYNKWINDPQRMAILLNTPNNICVRMGLIEKLRSKTANLPVMDHVQIQLLYDQFYRNHIKYGNLLMAAINENNLLKLDELLQERDLDLDYECNCFGTNPLIASIRKKRFQIVEKLISAGADINKFEFQGLTPLMTAARARDCREIVCKLISCGAQINAMDSGKNTALHYALFAGDAVGFRILLEAGGQLGQWGKSGAARNYANRNGYHEIVAILDEEAKNEAARKNVGWNCAIV